jgi:hypothetical protein|tara:strand:+ start:2486 stop:2788 length:303 start_codon:yes stop_codon:yes gene_type:complete
MSWEDILKQVKEIRVHFYNSNNKQVSHKIPMNKFDDIEYLPRKEQSKLIIDYLKKRPERFDFKGGLEYDRIEKPHPFKKDEEGNYVYSKEEQKRIQEKLQ